MKKTNLKKIRIGLLIFLIISIFLISVTAINFVRQNNNFIYYSPHLNFYQNSDFIHNNNSIYQMNYTKNNIFQLFFNENYSLPFQNGNISFQFSLILSINIFNSVMIGFFGIILTVLCLIGLIDIIFLIKNQIKRGKKIEK